MSLCVSLSTIACNIRGGVTGIVKDQTAEPASGARVEIFDLNKNRNVYAIDTATDGRFEYYEENITVNGYCGPSLIVTISKSGYATIKQEFKQLCQFKRYDPVLRRE